MVASHTASMCPVMRRWRQFCVSRACIIGAVLGVTIGRMTESDHWSAWTLRRSLEVPAMWEMEMGDNVESAVLAGGCAWVMQQLLRHPKE